MSCLQRGTAIQSRRLSEYSCYAPMVLRAAGSGICCKGICQTTNKVSQIASVDAVFWQMGSIWSAWVHYFGIFRYMLFGQDDK